MRILAVTSRTPAASGMQIRSCMASNALSVVARPKVQSHPVRTIRDDNASTLQIPLVALTSHHALVPCVHFREPLHKGKPWRPGTPTLSCAMYVAAVFEDNPPPKGLGIDQ
ncbi:hypothetical protein ColTof3_03614 [Colletotrichum tofieldiae]|nr:hypothetical protein ColTof3_03614 [Colletotrichum tofieldiae]GKT97408.1 hypothetical protein Ct61P_15258 [Colletotrichum tofieldiae]